MADNVNNNVYTDEYPEEEMSVELKLDDGRTVTCDVVTIFEVAGKDYVALKPQEEDPLAPEQEIWFYRYSEDESNPDIEPQLDYIDDDAEYECVLDAFEEYLDNQYFDEVEE